MGQVGPSFDIALGYLDPSTNLVKMVGYVVSPSGNSQEGTDVTDDSHLVQIGSPNSTDRFARFPQVSQGDWTKGERQRLYVEPAMYYLSDGNVDVSTPGNLTLFPGTQVDTFTLTGTYDHTPIQTDGGGFFIGANTAGGNAIYGGGGGALNVSNTMNGHEIFDLLYIPSGLMAITDQGIWASIGGTSASHVVNETIHTPQLPSKSLAYLDDNLYYLNNDINSLPGCVIRAYDITTGSVSTVHTTDSGEKNIQCICSTANGLFFATTSSLPFQTFFYTWDILNGGVPTRVAEVYGRTSYCFEALGTTYVLCRQFQPAYTTAPAWTLYAVVGSQVTVVDDARWIGDPNFAPTCTSVDTFFAGGSVYDFNPMLWTDGRFLYIAWPGLATRRVDLVNGGISSIGPNNTGGQGPVHAHRFITSAQAAYIDVASYANTIKITRANSPATSGSLVTSFIDMVSPGVGKIMRSVSFETTNPLVGTQAVNIAFRLSQNASFTNLTTQQTGVRNFIAAFPTGTKGTEVQLQITLVADAVAGPPIVSSDTVVMDVGRVETYTLACRRDQQYRSQDEQSVDAQKYSGQDLWANLENIRNIGGGYGYAFIPDPTQSNGVAAIQIQILDIQKQTLNGAATGQRTVNGETDMERDVTISMVEYFAPQ